MVQAVQKAVMATAAVELGALGLSGLVAAAVLDAAGLAGAGSVALAGFVILPSQRARLNKELGAKIDALHNEVREQLLQQYTREIESAERAMAMAVTPFYRYVAREEDKVRDLEMGVYETQLRMQQIRDNIAAAARMTAPVVAAIEGEADAAAVTAAAAATTAAPAAAPAAATAAPAAPAPATTV